MAPDQVFRWILLAGVGLLLPVGIYYRLKARTGERLDRRQEGWVSMVTLRLSGLATWGGMIAYLIDPASLAWAAIPLPTWLRFVGVGLGLGTGALIVWTLANLGPNLTDTVVTRREHTLVTTGPYRWIRHPFYLAGTLAFVAASLVTASGFIAVMGCTAVLLLSSRTRREEENLTARFGDAYRQYMARTGRFLPRGRAGLQP